MLIGLTYNLRSEYLARGFTAEQVAEFDCEETVDSLNDVLLRAGHEVVRIGNLENLMARLLNGQRWDLVFNIAEGLNGAGREAQIPALLDAFGIPHTFSDTEILAVALDKSLTNAVMKGHGVPVSDFFVIRTMEDCERLELEYPLFAKPVAEGTSRGITALSLIHDHGELVRYCLSALPVFKQPVLVERYLPGREFTVGMLGNGREADVLGVMEVVLLDQADASGYTYDNKQQYENRVQYRIVDEPAVALVARQAWAALNCLDAGRVDIRMDAAGKPHFLEVNPLAGLNPTYSDLCILARLQGLSYDGLIGRIMASAGKRCRNLPPVAVDATSAPGHQGLIA